MPYEVVSSDRCPTDRPYAVVKVGETRPRGCHPTKEDAMKQMAALYANEPGAKAEGTVGGTSISDLPASSYAYCEPDDGRAVASRCHFPIKDKNGKLDAAHVRNALARLSQSPFGEKARAAV